MISSIVHKNCCHDTQEACTVNREVRLVLQDLDKFDNLSAIVYIPKEEQEIDLGQELLKNGFAKVRRM